MFSAFVHKSLRHSNVWVIWGWTSHAWNCWGICGPTPCRWVLWAKISESTPCSDEVCDTFRLLQWVLTLNPLFECCRAASWNLVTYSAYWGTCGPTPPKWTLWAKISQPMPSSEEVNDTFRRPLFYHNEFWHFTLLVLLQSCFTNSCYMLCLLRVKFSVSWQLGKSGTSSDCTNNYFKSESLVVHGILPLSGAQNIVQGWPL